jgi:hypothetical protein
MALLLSRPDCLTFASSTSTGPAASGSAANSGAPRLTASAAANVNPKKRGKVKPVAA